MAKIFFEDADELLDIRYDKVFKAVFTRNSPESIGALSALVSALTGKELAVIEIIANEPPAESLSDRQIRFDINCRAKTGELINIEMNISSHSFNPARFEYHTARLFTCQDIRGIEKDYDDLKETYQITILTRQRIFQDDSYLHNFEYYDPENQISLSGKTRIVTIELSKLEKVIEKPIEKMNIKEYWAVYFGYLTDKSKRTKINKILEKEEGIAMASEVLLTISRDEDEQILLMSEYKYQLDKQDMLVTAKREGLQQGLEQGLQQGLEQGRCSGQQEIIDLLKSGKSPDEIIRDYQN